MTDAQIETLIADILRTLEKLTARIEKLERDK